MMGGGDRRVRILSNGCKCQEVLEKCNDVLVQEGRQSFAAAVLDVLDVRKNLSKNFGVQRNIYDTKYVVCFRGKP